MAGDKSAIFSFEYLYFTKGLGGLEVVERNEEHEDDEAGAEGCEGSKKRCFELMVVEDLKSGSVFAHAVLRQGLDAEGFAVVRLVEDIKWLGYAKLLVKSDNKSAIVSLCDGAPRRLRIGR